jgi:hypothetical protein
MPGGGLPKRERLRLVRPSPIGPDGGMGPEFSTGNADDDEVLRQIARLSPLSNPRQWMHFLPCRNEAAARAVAVELVGRWSVDVRRVKRKGWCVVAEQTGVITSAQAVREARLFFEDLVNRTPGASYDGWQASV